MDRGRRAAASAVSRRPKDIVRSKAKQKKPLSVSANFSCAFSIPDSDVGEVRNLNTVTPIERGTQIYFVTGDSLGGIGVFFRNGTLKGRARVTEDPGGVRGLMRSQGQSVLYSSHSFGFFSVTQIDVQYPPCSGWNSPLVDVVADPSYACAPPLPFPSAPPPPPRARVPRREEQHASVALATGWSSPGEGSEAFRFGRLVRGRLHTCLL
ncbi:unnamed protein product [Prorocentrum cordatum]|uniref:Uncharacterized protein n=1 Tax=Prorocentrum cordatum TaxID=2364126 RepID=A0ABN9SDN7_9DINO|nr:unnamed protein product [Polarella glacialis]